MAALGVNGGKKAHAATGDPLIIGQGNEAGTGDETTLVGNVGPTAALFQVENVFERGTSSLVGDGPNGATGVRGMSTSGPGVHASSEEGPAVLGVSGAPRFQTEGGPGFSLGANSGIEGHSGSGPGVRGQSQSGPGVQASSETGNALEVWGRAAFSTAGAAVVPKWRRTATVSDAAVTDASHVTVTFTGNPGWARVRWVERQPSTGFIVHLSGRSRRDVPFTYLIVEPGA